MKMIILASLLFVAPVFAGDDCDPVVQVMTFGGSSSVDYDLTFLQYPGTVYAVEIRAEVEASGTAFHAGGVPLGTMTVWLNGQDVSAPFANQMSSVDLIAPGFGIVPDFVTYVGDTGACPTGDFCSLDLATDGTGTSTTDQTDAYEGDGLVLLTLDPINWWSLQTGSGTSGVTGSFVNGTVTVTYFPCQVGPTNSCAEDIDGDGVVGLDDLLTVVFDFGCVGQCVGDINGDGTTDVQDLTDIIRNWGPCDE